ncbi:MAG: APC family permease [Marinifilaceae bacterium]
MDAKNNVNKTALFSIGTLVALNVATVVNIYGFPSEAVYGLSSISLYLIAIIVFLIPISLVSGELGSMFPRDGGVYTWVSEAFSPKVGVWAIWLQWIQSVFFYPLSLTFAAVTLSYVVPDEVVAQDLANNKYYIMAVILGIFWISTFIASRGVKNLGWLSRISVWLGIYVPAILLIGFAIYYVVTGGEIQMQMEPIVLFPRLTNIDQFVMAASIMLFFSGMEVNGAHVIMMRNPTKNYPRALIITALIIGLIFILGTLSISIIIPQNEINITQSVIVAFQKYLKLMHIEFLLPVIAIALPLGVFANTISWISGPSTVLRYVAQLGYFPKFIEKQNKKGAPIGILLIQFLIVTVLAFIYVVSAQIQQGYQLLLQITNAVYLTMYMILFLSYLRLRYKQPHVQRPFKVSRSTIVSWIIGIMGFMASLVSFVLCFFPPQQIGSVNHKYYLFILIAIYVILLLPPIAFSLKRHHNESSSSK